MAKDISPRNYSYYHLAAPADMDKDIGPSVHGLTTTTARRPQRTWAAQGTAPVKLFLGIFWAKPCAATGDNG